MTTITQVTPCPPTGTFELLSASQLAKKLGISRSLVYQWKAQNLIPYYRVTGTSQVFFTVDSIQRFFDLKYAVMPQVPYATTQLQVTHPELGITETR